MGAKIPKKSKAPHKRTSRRSDDGRLIIQKIKALERGDELRLEFYCGTSCNRMG
jgi:hypothetical protein